CEGREAHGPEPDDGRVAARVRARADGGSRAAAPARFVHEVDAGRRREARGPLGLPLHARGRGLDIARRRAERDPAPDRRPEPGRRGRPQGLRAGDLAAQVTRAPPALSRLRSPVMPRPAVLALLVAPVVCTASALAQPRQRKPPDPRFDVRSGSYVLLY